MQLYFDGSLDWSSMKSNGIVMGSKHLSFAHIACLSNTCRVVLTCVEPRWQVTQGILCWIVSICGKILQSLMAKWFQHLKSSFGSRFSPINLFDAMINFNKLVHSLPIDCLLKMTTQFIFTRETNFNFSRHYASRKETFVQTYSSIFLKTRSLFLG